MLTLVADRSVEVLGVTAAGLMIAGNDGELRVVASSRDAVRVLELFEVQAEHGPCPECYRSGVPIVDEQLRAVDRRWPEFAPRAVAAGFRSVHALPMRLRGRTIGVLSLFRADQASSTTTTSGRPRPSPTSPPSPSSPSGPRPRPKP